jgi:hypothetical protein
MACISTKSEDGGHFVPFDQNICRSKQDIKNGKILLYTVLKNSLIIQEENTKKNHKRVVSLYVIKNHVNLHKL